MTLLIEHYIILLTIVNNISMFSVSQEDYLRKIYSIAEKSCNKQVRSVEIAESLGVSRPATSKMLQKLHSQKLLFLQPYSTAKLTSKGFKIAQQIVLKHRLVEVLLAKILQVPIHNVCKEAHVLEHAFSDMTIRRLAKILKYPKHCPCGFVIPYRK